MYVAMSYWLYVLQMAVDQKMESVILRKEEHTFDW